MGLMAIADRSQDPSCARVQVSEIFSSIQGEGVSVGVPSVFVRLQGCTVGCSWCDTKYTWDRARGEALTLDALLSRVQAAGPTNVVVTGGEPLEHPAFVPLVAALKMAGYRVEVETAGTEVPPADLEVDQWNVSIKLRHSGVPDARRLRQPAIERFRDLGAWFKFVVGEAADVAEVVALQRRYRLSADHIMLMPLGMRREEQLARLPLVVGWCREHGFRLSPRLHILIWGARRGV
jgi:organic radical activating enzyme